MKKPTLEEVKKYFENAEEVVSVEGTKGKLSRADERGIHYWGGIYWFLDTKKNNIMLYCPSRGYAKILTYKEKTFTITESQIKTIHEKTSVSNQEEIEEWFPEVFESQVKELKIGTWYNYNNAIVNYQGTVNSLLQGYGIRLGEESWIRLGNMGRSPEEWKEASKKEVLKALKNEAVKRGFVKGGFVKDNGLHDSCKQNELLEEPIFDLDEEEFWIKNVGELNYNCLIFEYGIWAEVIETITLEEAEKQLGKKIIV